MKTKKVKKEKALLYARVAVQNQNQSPDRLKHQLDCLMIHCQDNNIKVEGLYCDVAGGHNFKREEFKQMMSDIKEGKVKADFILVTQQDRFCRNLNKYIKMTKKLETFGIKVKTIRNEDSFFVILNSLNSK